MGIDRCLRDSSNVRSSHDSVARRLLCETSAQLRVLRFQLSDSCAARVFPCFALLPGNLELSGSPTGGLVIRKSATLVACLPPTESLSDGSMLTVGVFNLTNKLASTRQLTLNGSQRAAGKHAMEGLVIIGRAPLIEMSMSVTNH